MLNLSPQELRIFVLAPRGRDGSLIAETLTEGRLTPIVCADVDTPLWFANFAKAAPRPSSLKKR